MSENPLKSLSFTYRMKATAKETLRQVDKALDVGVQAAIVGLCNTPPEMPVDWRSMLRVGGKFIKSVGKETAAVLFSKKEGK